MDTGTAGGRTVWDTIRDGVDPSEDGVVRVAESHRARLGPAGAAGLRSELRRAVLGLGPLEDLLDDEAVTDVLVNGSRSVWVDRGGGLEPVPSPLVDDEAVRRLAVRLSALAGQRLDDASPCVDGLLPGGVRLHAVLPPLVDGGPHLSLRVPRRQAPDLDVLARWGMFDPPAVEVLRQVVRGRLAFVVTGGTGSGKTTVLGAMLAEVPPDERIVVVEDVRELAVRHPHVVRLQGRAPNVEGRGEVTLTALVRQSLRMRPDRVVVGEVRGAEVRELLGALNTGHDGGCGTVHANSTADVVSRFEALGALAGMSPGAVHAQLVSAVDVVIHLGRHAGRRCLREVSLVERAADGRGVSVQAALLVAGTRTVHAEGWPALHQALQRAADRIGDRP